MGDVPTVCAKLGFIPCYVPGRKIGMTRVGWPANWIDWETFTRISRSLGLVIVVDDHCGIHMRYRGKRRLAKIARRGGHGYLR